MRIFDDPDIASIFDETLAGDPVITISAGLPDGERQRLLAFAQADQARLQQPNPATIMAMAEAGIYAYEQRTLSMPLGWEKYLVVAVTDGGFDLVEQFGRGAEAYRYLKWALHEMEAQGWAPDRRQSVIGQLHGHVMHHTYELGLVHEAPAAPRPSEPGPKRRSWWRR